MLLSYESPPNRSVQNMEQKAESRGQQHSQKTSLVSSSWTQFIDDHSVHTVCVAIGVPVRPLADRDVVSSARRGLMAARTGRAVVLGR